MQTGCAARGSRNGLPCKACRMMSGTQRCSGRRKRCDHHKISSPSSQVMMLIKSRCCLAAAMSMPAKCAKGAWFWTVCNHASKRKRAGNCLEGRGSRLPPDCLAAIIADAQQVRRRGGAMQRGRQTGTALLTRAAMVHQQALLTQAAMAHQSDLACRRRQPY